MDTQKPQNDTKPRFTFYEGFNGRYHKVAEIRDLIPQFKEFYFSARRNEPERSAIKIINDFNQTIAPLTFFPWEKQYRLWRKKWDAALLAESGYIEEPPKTRQLIRLQDNQGADIVPDEHLLEAGANTLAGELLNDAMGMLKADQESSDIYEEEILIKRRNYILNVFNYVNRAVQGKESLKLKSNADKRETLGFLTEMINRSTAGQITKDEFQMMRDSLRKAGASQVSISTPPPVSSPSSQ